MCLVLGTTSMHKNLESSENQNCKLFFYFCFTFCFQFVFCVFFISYISIFYWLSLLKKLRTLLMKPYSKLLSQVQHRFWSVPLISFKTLFAQVINFIALLTHYYSQLYSHHLLEFQFSFDLEFVLLRLKLLIYAQYV